MCGIAGMIALHKNALCDLKTVHRMTFSQRRRGPDDEGYCLVNSNGSIESFHGVDTPESWLELRKSRDILQNLGEKTTVALGHRRLKILDLSVSSHQPYVEESGKLSLVFNGEIYNYREIRAELEGKGYSFRSTGDTEVLLYSYMEWGEDCVKKFNGMFAFAIFDKLKNLVFIARDRLGIKPLYYYQDSSKFLFGSDIKSILSSGVVEAEINWDALWHSMTLSIMPRPTTCFEGIIALEPGSHITIHLENGKVSRKTYWELPVGVQHLDLSLSDAIESVEDELKKSIKYRLIADVETATFMSGGIDSTLVTSLAAKNQAGIKAFTLGFTDVDDEVEVASENAGHFDVDHVVKSIRSEEAIDGIDDMIKCYEEPYGSLAPNYLISKMVAEHGVKVVLSGLGGDELFAGYSIYHQAEQWKKFQTLSFVSKLFPAGVSSKIDKLKHLSEAKNEGQFYVQFKSMNYFSERQKKQLFKAHRNSSIDVLNTHYNSPPKAFQDLTESIGYFDKVHYLANHHLYRLDQFGMHFSIEARFPFLDHNLVELSMKIPSRHKILNGTRKLLLRKMAEKHISQSSLNMPKSGFSLPMKVWVTKNLKDYCNQTAADLSEREFFNKPYIDEMANNGGRNFKKLWYLIMLEQWFKTFIDGGLKTEFEKSYATHIQN